MVRGTDSPTCRICHSAMRNYETIPFGDICRTCRSDATKSCFECHSPVWTPFGDDELTVVVCQNINCQETYLVRNEDGGINPPLE